MTFPSNRVLSLIMSILLFLPALFLFVSSIEWGIFLYVKKYLMVFINYLTCVLQGWRQEFSDGGADSSDEGAKI